MQFLSFTLVLFSFGGGVFIPLNEFPHVFKQSPSSLRSTASTSSSRAVADGSVHVAWVANAVVWLAIFAGGAAWLFRKDTARV